MITCEEPFAELQTFAIPQAVLDGQRPKFPKDYHAKYIEIMKSAWNQDPMERPSFSELEVQFTTLLQDFEATKPRVEEWV